MSETQVKRGRPAKKAEAPKKFAVKQNITEDVAREYIIKKGYGAVYMMQQRNVTVYDKNRDEVRQIRYCPNEQSIYVDEQSENAVRKSVMFMDGRLFVPRNKPNLRNYLDVHPDNKANGGNVYELVDKKREAQVDVDKDFATAEAVMLVKEKPFEDLLSVAASLNFNVDREASQIKHDLLIYAKKNPVQFVKMFDNPEVTLKAKIRMAMKYGVLEESKGAVRWKDTGKMIVSVPVGKVAVDVLLRFLLTDAGAPTVEELDRQL